MARLAYEQARVNIATQNSYLVSLRKQALGVAGAEAALISLAVRPFEDFPPAGRSWILAAAFTAASLFCGWLVIAPRGGWRNTTNIERMLAEDRGLAESDLLRKLTRNLARAASHNKKFVAKLQGMFHYQLYLAAVSVVLWMAV